MQTLVLPHVLCLVMLYWYDIFARATGPVSFQFWVPENRILTGGLTSGDGD